MKKHYTTLELEKEKKLEEPKEKKLENKKGEQKNKIEVIKRMLNANLGIDLIKECTNATDEEIEEAKISKK